MNYFSHAWIASSLREQPRFVLGAMLPDFAGWLGVRVTPTRDPTVAAGIALHHETDAAFHGSAGFRALNSESVEALEARGLPRGPARGAAHVGIELLLDATLAAETPRARFAFGEALAVPAVLDWPNRDASRRFDEVRRRLRDSDPTADLGRPDATASRIRRALQPRRRLRLAPAHQRAVADWLRELEPRIFDEAGALADATLAKLSTPG